MLPNTDSLFKCYQVQIAHSNVTTVHLVNANFINELIV